MHSRGGDDEHSKDYHSSLVGGHHIDIRTTHKILQCGFYWASIYRDSRDFVKSCNQFQRQGNISQCEELPMTPNLELELFYV